MNHDAKPVSIVMIEDDEGHARLIEKNIRRDLAADIADFALQVADASFSSCSISTCPT